MKLTVSPVPIKEGKCRERVEKGLDFVVFYIMLKPKVSREELSLEYYESLPIFAKEAASFLLLFVQSLEGKIPPQISTKPVKH